MKKTTFKTSTWEPSPWLGMIMTILMVVVVRELCMLICQQFGMATAGNIVGLVVMFLILFIWRLIRSFGHKQKDCEHSKAPALPSWLTNASNKILIDSGFAFLPVSAGAGILLFTLGDEFWGVVIILFVSTLLPLWALARLGNVWLNHTHSDEDSKK